jgi:hypothetical protein
MGGRLQGSGRDDVVQRLADDDVVDDLIADCDGDPRAAVAALLRIVQALVRKNNELAEAVSPGYARLAPRGFFAHG